MTHERAHLGRAAHRDGGGRGGTARYAIAICPGDYMAAMTEFYNRDGRKMWALTGQDEVTVSSRGVIGWTALVPVEAVEEESLRRVHARGSRDDLLKAQRVRRLVTEWEPS